MIPGRHFAGLQLQGGRPYQEDDFGFLNDAKETDPRPSHLLVVLADGMGGHSGGARELLAERAKVLGGAVALLRDVLNPDDVVVGGQAFTEYPEGLPEAHAAFAAQTVLGSRDIRVTAFGNRVQEAGAGVVSLSSLYADPLGAFRRASRDRPDVSA